MAVRCLGSESPAPIPHAVWSLAWAPPASGTTPMQGHAVCLEAAQGLAPGHQLCPPLSWVLVGSKGSQGGVRGAGAPWGWLPGSLPAGRGPSDSAGKGSVSCGLRRPELSRGRRRPVWPSRHLPTLGWRSPLGMARVLVRIPCCSWGLLWAQCWSGRRFLVPILSPCWPEVSGSEAQGGRGRRGEGGAALWTWSGSLVSGLRRPAVISWGSDCSCCPSAEGGSGKEEASAHPPHSHLGLLRAWLGACDSLAWVKGVGLGPSQGSLECPERLSRLRTRRAGFFVK